MNFDLLAFIKESNMIENIDEVRPFDLQAHKDFLANPNVTVQSVCEFAKAVTEGYGKLRIHMGMDVTVGGHRPPLGGPEIIKDLKEILHEVTVLTPWELHVEFECLHPFRDGNGRAGRALWLWSMRNYSQKVYSSSFLRTFYYQTLEQEQNAE